MFPFPVVFPPFSRSIQFRKPRSGLYVFSSRSLDVSALYSSARLCTSQYDEVFRDSPFPEWIPVPAGLSDGARKSKRIKFNLNGGTGKKKLICARSSKSGFARCNFCLALSGWSRSSSQHRGESFNRRFFIYIEFFYCEIPYHFSYRRFVGRCLISSLLNA